MESPLPPSESDVSGNDAITPSASKSEAAAGALQVSVSAEFGNDSHGNPEPEPGPHSLNIPYRGLPTEIIENILRHMDGNTLKSTRLASRYMAMLSGKILRQAIIIDITPTEDCYSMLYCLTRIHHERSLTPYVRAIRITTRKYDKLMLASDVLQYHIIVKLLHFVAELNNLIHIELDGSYLSPLQQKVLCRDDRLKKWTAQSIELRGISYGTFDKFYSWPCVAALNVGCGIEHRAFERIRTETHGQLQRLAFTATRETRWLSRFLGLRRRFYNVPLQSEPLARPIVRVFNSVMLEELSHRCPRLKWLAIRCEPLSDPYRGSHLSAAKVEFLKALQLLTYLERLSIQVHSHVGFLEAHKRNCAIDEDLWNRKTCEWYEAMAMEVMTGSENLVEVFVRASWPHYFVARRGVNNVITVRQGQFESFNRHQFPIGLVY